ncbi:MAG: transposase [Candidatus Binatia bacterium]
MFVEDETTLRLFPPLRSQWKAKGQTVTIPVTGRNAKRVLFGAINPCTGRRVVTISPAARGAHFLAFLHKLRRHYPGRKLVLLIDRAPAHLPKTLERRLECMDIAILWLPIQWPELNAMDHLWRHVKGKIAANHQYLHVDQLAKKAAAYVTSLTDDEALRQAGLQSENQWLKRIL